MDIKNISDLWAVIKAKDEGGELAFLGAEYNMTGNEPHDFLTKLFEFYIPR